MEPGATADGFAPAPCAATGLKSPTRSHGNGCMTQAWSNMQAEPLAEDAWLLRFGETIDAEVNARVLAVAARLQVELADAECVPAYASLLLRFDPARWLDDQGRFSARRLHDAIGAVLQSPGSPETASRELTIPVCYGGEF